MQGFRKSLKGFRYFVYFFQAWTQARVRALQSHERIQKKNKGVGVVATHDGVWHKDSHYRRKSIEGGTQVDDFIMGIIGRFFTKIFGEDFGGVRGTPTPQ